jgi:hypothetical protein
VLLVCSGVSCARSYLRLAFTSSDDNLDLKSLPCSGKSNLPHDGCRAYCFPVRLSVQAVDALTSAACLGDLCHAARLSLANVMECFSIFDRPFTVQIQEVSMSTSESGSLIGVHDGVLSDQSISTILLHSRFRCHFPLVAPNRRLRTSYTLQVKIW